MVLMENAGRSVAASALRLLGDPRGKTVTIVCGKGNNGGDGFVAARHLAAAGVTVRVLLLSRGSALGKETLRHFSILRRVAATGEMRGRITIVEGPASGKFTPGKAPAAVIDAMFGTGFRGKLTGSPLKASRWMNRCGCPVISVDAPSGLNTDDGTGGGACVKADLTVTMGALKRGLLIGSGPGVCGRIEIADLGVGMTGREAEKEGTWLVTEGDVRGYLSPRPRNSHKHSVGKILIFAGSVGLTGAAALAATAAMKGGAGAVVLGIPKSIYPVLGRKLTEVMVRPLPESEKGTLCSASLDEVRRELDWADVILAGPGLGMNRGAHDFLQNLLKLSDKRFVIDADALNHVAADRTLLSHFKRNTGILTPHVGEFSRLSGISPKDIELGRISLPPGFAKKHHVHLILKGSPTVTAIPDGRVFINPTGNPGMATAGMGDVLAGLLAALWAASGDAERSAYASVFIHGRAGDLATGRIGIRALMAGDVLNKLPEVIAGFEDNQMFLM